MAIMDDMADAEVLALDGSDTQEGNTTYSGVVAHILNKYNKSKTRRMNDEERWLQSYRNYRGIYGPEVQFTETEKSQAFIKITKMKVLAAYSQITEVLFSGNKFPIGVEATTNPIGSTDSVFIDANSKTSDISKKSATTRRPELSNIGPYTDTLKPVMDDVQSGPGQTPTTATYEPAKEAAYLMEKEMSDQLEESEASKHLRATVFEQCLFGSGIMKGPFAVDKEYPRWTSTGVYQPEKKTIPNVTNVSIWNFYPDASARNISECEYIIERHRMSRTELRALKKRPFFIAESIDDAIDYGESYVPEYWEQTLEDYSVESDIDRYEVLEYWGTIDKELSNEYGFRIPNELKKLDSIQANIWICNGKILRFVMNPFTPSRIPYAAVPYEMNPYSFFGIGVAENMEDTQLLMNGFIRMAVDNAALSGNLLVEVDVNNLDPADDFKIYPGKVFRRVSGAPGQAVFGTKFPNVTNELFQAFDKVRQLSDEATGMPSFAHGQTGVTGVGRTASGISMLLGAAAQNIKSVVRNIDDYLLAPMGKALFSFNMQFNFKEEYTQGDLEVIARGTESLMRNEIRSQKLLQLFQIAGANPAMAPLVKWDYALREYAKSIDLDAEKLLNDPRAAIVQAIQMKNLGDASGQQQPSAQPAPGNPSSAPSVNDPTGSGGGNLGPGNAPPPGVDGFSGEQS